VNNYHDLRKIRRDRIKAALLAIIENPLQLTDSETQDAYAQIHPKPIRFAGPFEDASVIEDEDGELLYLNIGGEFGRAIFRCLAACELAQLEERLPLATGIEYQQLRMQGFQYFVQELFRIVQDHELIQRFVPPPLPDKITCAPFLSNTDLWIYRERVSKDWTKAGPFGRVFTEWPTEQD